MEIVPVCELLETASVEIDTVEMLIIRVLVLVLSVGSEIYGAGLLVNLQNALYMPRSLGDSVLHISLTVIQIQMCPAVSFAPLDDFLSVADNAQRTCLLICIHALLDYRYDAVLTDGI